MNKFAVIVTAFHVLAGMSAQAQQVPMRTYHSDVQAAPNSTGNSGTSSNINVLYHRIAWTVNPNDASKNITGTITTHFKTLVANVAAISFDLNKNSFNNGALVVTYHGTNCSWSFPASGSVNILNITLPSTIVAVNTIDSIVVNYSGTPPPASGSAQGYQRSSYVDASAVTQFYNNSLSESYEDRDWWPCKADMQDKVDSMDIQVTVPWNGVDTFWVASNGVLIDSAISGANRIFKYKTRYPIASYLVCLTVAKFNRYYRSVQVGSTTVPVRYYLLGGKAASYYTNATTAMDKINAVVVAYSQKLGDYPFKLEKHGFYDGLVGAGGMEHQTFSAIAPGSLASLGTLSHELMHQWFGDNVTFATWNDLWLAEGFARYGESLAAELVPSLGLNPHTSRTNAKSSALGNTVSAWIPNSNTGNSAGIWSSSYGSSVYVRGAMVVSMLRAMSGDARFFQALTNYQANLAGKSANADSLKNYFNALLGTDISEFFRDYVGGSGPAVSAVGGIGNPIYNIGWNAPVTNTLVLRINSQAKSATNNVVYYNGPVVVRATAPGKDTTIVLFDWGSGNLSFAGNGISPSISNNLMSYRLSFTPTALVYDDSAKTLSTGSTTQDAAFVGYVWNGSVSNVWTNPANWSTCCGVPPNGADVTVATTVNTPVLPGPVTIRNLTINATKQLNIGSNTLTVTGAIDGTGSFSGSATSNLILTGNTGILNFDQTSATTRSLNSLTLAPGSTVRLATNLVVTTFNSNPASNFTVTTGVNLITK
jgi:aminopeptidase N